MKLTVIGTGYVGLVTGACLADVGNHVVCFDLDQGKIDRLKAGQIPIYEPGLEAIVARNIASKRLSFTTDPKEAGTFGLVQMIAVGTPPGEDGSADLKYVLAAAQSVAEHMDGYRVVVDKSTVPVGTADKVHATIAQTLAKRGANFEFDVVSNPEFLKEGAAIEDFSKPDRIVLGVESAKAEAVMRELYAPLQRNHEKCIVMSRRSAEMTKYAANAMLATRISFMNELSRVCDVMGVDIEDVRQGMGSDPRIGYSFLYAGTGYGGSCFPKDVKALLKTGQQVGVELQILDAVESANAIQKLILVAKAKARFGSLKGLHFALWGLAFKPNTDDIREAPALEVIKALVDSGATVCCYDPVAAHEAKKAVGNQPGVSFAASSYEALNGADALMIVTEWKEFRSPDFEQMGQLLKNKVILDGRNLYAPKQVQAQGFEYFAVGRLTAQSQAKV